MAECDTVKAERVLIVACGLIVLAYAGATLADGGMFLRRNPYNQQADIFQPTQKVYIRWDGSQERLLIQTKYEGPAEEMVWLIPVPSQPTVQRADGGVFVDLGKRTADYAIDYTDFVGLEIPTFSASPGGSGSDSSAVEWHERIGDYDVALLQPVGGENVIAWLNANDFAVPEEMVPTFEDYIANGWWMVAARIHPDALTPITQEKLAKGTLHPLEMTFQSSACIYPMRLTSMAAGPVEELIYIEGPAHYEPTTLTETWWIELFGGPIRTVPTNYVLTSMERAVEIIEGRTRTEVENRLTKLRRVFQPSEMTDDLVFQEVDLTAWLASQNAVPFVGAAVPSSAPIRPQAIMDFTRLLVNADAARIAQAATQYGRWRDPNAIIPLVNALSPEALDLMRPEPSEYRSWASPVGRFLSALGMYRWTASPTGDYWPLYPGCGYVRSCIWALGEIGIEHPLGDEAERALLDCAQHDNQFIRMEAYVALTKMRSQQCGPLYIDRLAQVFQNSPRPPYWDLEVQIAMGEMDILADWIWQFGTGEQKDTFIELLHEQVGVLPPDTWYHVSERQMWDLICYGHWPTWIVWRAACTEDPRLLGVLAERSASLPGNASNYQREFLLRAQAACGATEPIAMMVQQVVDDASDTVQRSLGGMGGHTFLDSLYWYRKEPISLRVAILQRRGLRNDLYPIPLDASDKIIRTAMSQEPLSDWHVLHMLARIRRPQPKDRDALMQVWDNQDESLQLLAVDVLYVWSDVQTLTECYGLAESPVMKAEIAWALAELEIPKAASIVEEQVHASWNPQWLSLGRTFIHSATNGRSSRMYRPSYLSTEMWRVEWTFWDYFHPTSGVLDDERLAVLKRIAADGTIHAGMRFDLLGKDYGGTEWGLPLLEQAARDILAVDSSPSTVERIMSMMKSVGNGGFAVWP